MSNEYFKNIVHFPEDFMFQLTDSEVDFMVSQNAIPSCKQLALDLKKHNQQYPPITIETFKNAHDRFLIPPDNTILDGLALRLVLSPLCRYNP